MDAAKIIAPVMDAALESGNSATSLQAGTSDLQPLVTALPSAAENVDEPDRTHRPAEVSPHAVVDTALEAGHST